MIVPVGSSQALERTRKVELFDHPQPSNTESPPASLAFRHSKPAVVFARKFPVESGGPVGVGIGVMSLDGRYAQSAAVNENSRSPSGMVATDFLGIFGRLSRERLSIELPVGR